MLTSLEVKTSYSILGSLNKIEALVSRAKELGYSSLLLILIICLVHMSFI